MGRKFREGAGFPSNTEMSRKLGRGSAPIFGEGRAGSHLTQSRLGWVLRSYHVAS